MAVMKEVDLGQAAKIVWYSASGTPSSREFGSLQNAINFAFTRLSEANCERSLIVFDGSLGILNLSKPDVRRQVRRLVGPRR
jgi:hypothetical protein